MKEELLFPKLGFLGECIIKILSFEFCTFNERSFNLDKQVIFWYKSRIFSVFPEALTSKTFI